MYDAFGNEQSAALPFAWKSSNEALLTVDDDGLCTVTTPADDAWPPGGEVTVTVSYPFAGGTGPGTGTISTSVQVAVTPEPGKTWIVLTFEWCGYDAYTCKWGRYKVVRESLSPPPDPQGWVTYGANK